MQLSSEILCNVCKRSPVIVFVSGCHAYTVKHIVDPPAPMRGVCSFVFHFLNTVESIQHIIVPKPYVTVRRDSQRIFLFFFAVLDCVRGVVESDEPDVTLLASFICYFHVQRAAPG